MKNQIDNFRLLAYRDAFGLGDWIMSMTVLKLLCNKFPNCKMDINLVGRLGVAPRLIVEVVRNFDVRFSKILMINNIDAIRSNYDFVTGHMIYNLRTTKNLISSMVDVLNANTGLGVEYKDNVYSKYVGPLEPVPVPESFILMPSCGKNTKLSSRKDWGFQNLDRLCSLLCEAGHSIVQIGSSSDPALSKASYRYLSLSLAQIHFLMSNCQFFIGLLNGLSVYSGHHEINTCLLHHNNVLPFSATFYTNQFPVDVTGLTPEDVFDIIQYIKW